MVCDVLDQVSHVTAPAMVSALAVDEVRGNDAAAAAAGRRAGDDDGGGGDGAWLYLVLYRIRWCFLPIVIAGTITNCLNFFILSRKEMRCSSFQSINK